MYFFTINEVIIIILKDMKKKEKYKLVRDMNENAGVLIEKLANEWNVDKRTIYRWIQKASGETSNRKKKMKKKVGRRRQYPDVIFERIVELKTKRPGRSAKMVRRKLKKE